LVATIEERIFDIKENIRNAAERSGRKASDIVLMAVTKTRTLDEILEAAGTGEISVFGENRVQEAESKILSCPSDIGMEWHLIGHLQRNKARKAVDLFKCVQSVDSVRLAETLDRLCSERDSSMDIFLEINTSGESSKFGIHPDDAESICLEIMEKCCFLNINGFMTVGPLSSDEKLVRSSFEQLRLLKEKVEITLGREIPHLSMGMSSDYKWAIEEGSTMVRIGTSIFGPRDYNRN
jgi:pyridoxal phosphate enzyme (YggS family)